MKMKNVLVAAGSVAILSLVSCSKEDSTMNLTTNLDSKAVSNVWTSSGNPKWSEMPTFYQLTGTNAFHFDGKITGLGNADGVILTIEAVIMVNHSCFNPGNGELVPGQSKPVTKTFERSFPVRNGKFDFAVDMPEVTISDLEVSCPNDKWAQRIDGVTVKSFVIKLNGVEFYSKTI